MHADYGRTVSAGPGTHPDSTGAQYELLLSREMQIEGCFGGPSAVSSWAVGASGSKRRNARRESPSEQWPRARTPSWRDAGHGLASSPPSIELCLWDGLEVFPPSSLMQTPWWKAGTLHKPHQILVLTLFVYFKQ